MEKDCHCINLLYALVEIMKNMTPEQREKFMDFVLKYLTIVKEPKDAEPRYPIDPYPYPGFPYKPLWEPYTIIWNSDSTADVPDFNKDNPPSTTPREPHKITFEGDTTWDNLIDRFLFTCE